MFADHVVSFYDQNVGVHLPDQTVATDVEFRALDMVLDLLHLDRNVWKGRTFTTGATAANILGLACGREFVLNQAAHRAGLKRASVGELGILEICKAAGIESIQILTTLGHSSLSKAASIVGIGRSGVKVIPQAGHHLKFDLNRIRDEARKREKATILVVSCGEVNTGHYATNGLAELQKIRRYCDAYNIWMHVDGAFGIFSRVLDDTDEFSRVKKGCEGIELADSIGGDCHKLLNVPYDCGLFFCRHPKIMHQVFQNSNAAYLSSSGGASVPSPLNVGMENSRRFRALPVYATLRAYGREGYRSMLQQQIRLARSIAEFLFDHPQYEVLPAASSKEALLDSIFIIVLFRAKDEHLNKELVVKINASSKIYVSGTSWDGKPACRFAISNWQADEHRDIEIVKEVLESVLQNQDAEI